MHGPSEQHAYPTLRRYVAGRRDAPLLSATTAIFFAFASLTFSRIYHTLSLQPRQYCKAGKLSTEALFASPERVGVEGEGFTVILDLFSRFSSSYAELEELVRPMGEASNKLSRLLQDLKLHLRSAVMAVLITLVNGIRHDRSDIAESGTVSVLTRSGTPPVTCSNVF